MILSDKTLIKMLQDKELVVSPIDIELQVQPASIDIRLGSSFSIPAHNIAIIDIDKPINYEEKITDNYILKPKHFVLATTREYFKLPDHLTGRVDGRSSIGRMGLFIQNAGWIDPGFEGEITLELFNASDMPIILKCGMRIGQVVFSPLDSKALHPYRGKYNGQTGATGSRIFLDSERNNS